MVATRDLACNIVDLFDDLLKEKSIEIKCSDENEQRDRHDSGSTLYESEYWNLVNKVQSLVLLYILVY